MRKVVFAMTESTFPVYKNTRYATQRRQKIHDWVLSEMRKVAPEKYHEMLTPNYDVGCKRRIFDVEWLSCLHDPQVELTTAPLTGVQEKTITLGPGRMYPPETNWESNVPTDEVKTIPADVIILANGFQVSKWLLPLRVTGRHGQDLHDVFDERGGPQMYEGVALDDFPNFFSILGPNTVTGHSSSLLAVENSVNLSLKLMAPILKGDASTVEVKQEAEAAYTAKIQDALKDMVWQTGGCTSWYRNKDTNWNGKSYPFSQIWYGIRCTFPTWSDWQYQYTKSGKIKRGFIDVVNYSGPLAIASAMFYMKSQQYADTTSMLADLSRLYINGTAIA